MSNLATLRSQLGSLQRRRTSVRLGTGYAALILAVMWALAIAFIADWTFEMNRPQRFVLLLLCITAIVWAFFRFTRPFLGLSETEIDLALVVQQRHGVDSDLVAALQFESPEAAGWGSLALEDAVIKNVQGISSSLNVFHGFSYQQIKRRFGVLMMTAVVVLSATILAPNYAQSFFNRLFLGSAHYPTKTRIETIKINGRTVFPPSEDAGELRMAYGRPVKFDVRCSGELPETGMVALRSEAGGIMTEIGLLPANKTADDSTSPTSSTDFKGELPRLVDTLYYQVYVGDAWTDPLAIQVIPLPIINVVLTPHPPKYAANHEALTNSNKQDRQASSRQIAVIEGTDVDISVSCLNKTLKYVTLSIGENEYVLEKGNDGKGDAQTWTLNASKSPLHRIAEPVRYKIQVEDTDGLQLDSPYQGAIRIKTDRGPRVLAKIVSRRVIPTAVPNVYYGAKDDFGLAHLKVEFLVVRTNGETETITNDIKVVAPAEQPQTELTGRYPLDLEPLKLVKGDQVKVTLEAVDYRGELPGKPNVSEPLILEVTDTQGVLAGLFEVDVKTAKQLDEMIATELGIGGSK